MNYNWFFPQYEEFTKFFDIISPNFVKNFNDFVSEDDKIDHNYFTFKKYILSNDDDNVYFGVINYDIDKEEIYDENMDKIITTNSITSNNKFGEFLNFSNNMNRIIGLKYNNDDECEGGFGVILQNSNPCGIDVFMRSYDIALNVSTTDSLTYLSAIFDILPNYSFGINALTGEENFNSMYKISHIKDIYFSSTLFKKPSLPQDYYVADISDIVNKTWMLLSVNISKSSHENDNNITIKTKTPIINDIGIYEHSFRMKLFKNKINFKTEGKQSILNTGFSLITMANMNVTDGHNSFLFSDYGVGIEYKKKGIDIGGYLLSKIKNDERQIVPSIGINFNF